MKPGISNILNLFNGYRVFVIPFYQRSYVWGKQQWERLLSDLIALGNKETDYFLGVVILKQIINGTSVYGDYKVVIDGQQRLTTLAIFLKVLYLKNNANDWFVKKFFVDDETFAICHSHIDRDDFARIMTLTSCEDLVGKDTDNGIKHHSNILQAYDYFRKTLDPSLINIPKLLNNVNVIDLVIDHNDDEQQIFDTINSLGVDLTTAELLKNHLFSEDNLDTYKKLWVPAFENDEECTEFWAQPLLKGRNKQKNIEAFLNAFLQIKVQEKSKEVSALDKEEFARSSTLFYSYKKFIKDYYCGQEFDFVKELVEYAKIYRKTFSPKVTENTLTFAPGLERINFLIFAADCTTMIPYVMFVIKNVDDTSERIKIFDYLEAYIVRRIICKMSTKNYSDLFSEELVNSNVRTAEDFIRTINKKDGSLAMPNNKELLRCCKEVEHPNYRGLTILYLMESKMSCNPYSSMQLRKYNDYTLEHLMPQKWEKNWPLPQGADSEERSKKIKTLGNFTMLTQSLNSSISNADWTTKVKGKDKNGLKAYAAGLLTMEGVLDLQIWDETAIESRSTWLAKKASELWPSMIPNDTKIGESILDDEGEIEVDQLTGEERVIRRDTTKYSLDGVTFMGKSYFGPHIVKKYLEKHNKLTYAEIKEKFPDSLLETRHKCLGLICPVSVYEQWDYKYKTIKYHADKPESKLLSDDGIEFYVNTQWTAPSIQNIIQIAKDDGWDVMIKL